MACWKTGWEQVHSGIHAQQGQEGSQFAWRGRGGSCSGERCRSRLPLLSPGKPAHGDASCGVRCVAWGYWRQVGYKSGCRRSTSSTHVCQWQTDGAPPRLTRPLHARRKRLGTVVGSQELGIRLPA